MLIRLFSAIRYTLMGESKSFLLPVRFLSPQTVLYLFGPNKTLVVKNTFILQKIKQRLSEIRGNGALKNRARLSV